MKTQEFNIQDYLSTKTDRKQFLLECFRQDLGDGNLITAALKDVVEAAGKAEIAAAINLTERTLTRQLAKGETVPFTTVAAIAQVIGVRILAKKAKVKKVKKAKAKKVKKAAKAALAAEAPAEAKPAKKAKKAENAVPAPAKPAPKAKVVKKAMPASARPAKPAKAAVKK